MQAVAGEGTYFEMPMDRKRLRGISKATKLLLARGENDHVDYKRTSDAASAEDFVSFANREGGGTLLLGVDEGAGLAGAQIGVIVGCRVDDGTILQIVNKALSCIPPIAIEVSVENSFSKPILRIDLPPSKIRPHCTAKGLYLCRDGNRNRPLQPTELLEIFLKRESETFARNFGAAAKRISSDLQSLEISLTRSIRAMGDQLDWADSQFGDTESMLQSILALVRTQANRSADISTRLRAMFKQDNRDDPVHAKIRKRVLEETLKKFAENPSLVQALSSGGSVTLTPDEATNLELEEKDFREILREAYEAVKKQAS